MAYNGHPNEYEGHNLQDMPANNAVSFKTPGVVLDVDS